MTKIKVTKMQGCGNDFVIVDYDEYIKSEMQPDELAKKLCDRHFGVGADGMIIPKIYTRNADISWDFYNSDGSTAQMCGNGMRCFARYVYDNKLVNKTKFSVETLAGIIKPEIFTNEILNTLVKVNMGAPVLEEKKIPFKGAHDITINGRKFDIFPISMGNPHCVIITKEKPSILAAKYGAEIEKHLFFPEKTNVEFIRIRSSSEIDMCVYERGCGITLACGTGACASAVVCILNNLTENKVQVNLPGGVLYIEWQGSADDTRQDVYLIGSAQYTFFAEYML